VGAAADDSASLSRSISDACDLMVSFSSRRTDDDDDESTAALGAMILDALTKDSPLVVAAANGLFIADIGPMTQIKMTTR
jgi:hypothetical protein